jgi:hypothetical protein
MKNNMADEKLTLLNDVIQLIERLKYTDDSGSIKFKTTNEVIELCVTRIRQHYHLPVVESTPVSFVDLIDDRSPLDILPSTEVQSSFNNDV